MHRLALLASFLTACATDTNDVVVRLSPDVVSSLDGTLQVRATAFGGADPVDKQAIELTVDYTDRNGTPHDIAPVDGTTDANGVFETTIEGFTFDGTGTITATATVGSAAIIGEATFAVLDRTPPTVEIAAPADGQVHLNSDSEIQIHVADEIGVSSVTFETTAFSGGGNGGNNGSARSTVVASGSTDTMVQFAVRVPDNATLGQTITLFAIAEDLSGNEAAAQPVVVTVAQ